MKRKRNLKMGKSFPICGAKSREDVEARDIGLPWRAPRRRALRFVAKVEKLLQEGKQTCYTENGAVPLEKMIYQLQAAPDYKVRGCPFSSLQDLRHSLHL